MARKLIFSKHSLLNSGLVLLLGITGCQCSTKNDNASQGKSDSPEEQLFTKGKSVYVANCISCHNSNPKAQGSLGPEVFGSSKELLTARLMTASYPEGYTAKRNSKAMPALPHLSNDIDALVTYLNRP